MTNSNLNQVPGRAHYSLNYLRSRRLFSYAHQINTVLSYDPKTVIEVGAGGGLVTYVLKSVGINVTTVDIQPELNPDVLASVTEIPFADGQADVALCCQVLEHLPFDQFKPAIRELWRISNRGLVISLPDATPYYEFRMRLPKLPKLTWFGSRSKDPGKKWREDKWSDSGHYWEIGYTETPLRVVMAAISEVVGLVPKTWRVPENYYHRFFSLSKQR